VDRAEVLKELEPARMPKIKELFKPRILPPDDRIQLLAAQDADQLAAPDLPTLSLQLAFQLSFGETTSLPRRQSTTPVGERQIAKRHQPGILEEGRLSSGGMKGGVV